ncbi:MAG: hypothetical protein QM758_01385 [Armatimonas sp.]
METALRTFGWLGAILAIGIGVLGILIMLSLGGHIDPVFCLYVLGLFLASVRLISLRRWGAVVLCAYGLWMIKDSLYSGLKLWSVAWIAFSVTLTILTIRGWRTLRPGL